MSVSCRNILYPPCLDPPQLLDSGNFDSLQAVNLKLCNLIEVKNVVVSDAICVPLVTGLLPQ